MGRSWSLLSIIKPGIYKCWPVLQLPFCSGDDETWFISRDLETNEPLWRTIVPLRTGGGPNRREESKRPWLARRSDRFSRWFSAVLRQSRRLLIPIVRKQQRCFALGQRLRSDTSATAKLCSSSSHPSLFSFLRNKLIINFFIPA